jgi:hypothetical protein
MIYHKVMILTNLYFVLALFPLQARNNNLQAGNIEDTLISKISYSSSGGRSGSYESLDISANALIYVQGRNGDEKTIKEKTARSFWHSLTNAINIKDFDKIKSDPGHALFDGTDITITIEKGKQKHSIVNGNEDILNYQRISGFTDLLEKTLTGLRKKIK